MFHSTNFCEACNVELFKFQKNVYTRSMPIENDNLIDLRKLNIPLKQRKLQFKVRKYNPVSFSEIQNISLSALVLTYCFSVSRSYY